MAEFPVSRLWEYWAETQAADRATRLAHEKLESAAARVNSQLWDMVESRAPEALETLTAAARAAPSEDALAWFGAGQLESWIHSAGAAELSALREAATREPALHRALRYSSLTEEQRRVLLL